MKFTSLKDVVNGRLCVGCGACSFVSGGTVRMREIRDQGWRPARNEAVSGTIPEHCLSVCPAIASRVEVPKTEDYSLPAFGAGLGPVLEMWEAHATDAALRNRGASGGALSILAAFALEKRGMEGVLHIAQDQTDPFRNVTVLSRSREELQRRTGSRYAPASLCERLDLVESCEKPCVVIGQPSEIAALRKVEAIRDSLREKVGLTLSFFCAGSPSMQGTVDLIESRGIDPKEVTHIRYRGRGWPGHFAVWVRGQADPVLEMTYAESWAFLQSHRSWGVHLWPDGAGEHADISCGDPWYREVQEGEEGSSLIMARTAHGRAFVQAAIEAGYLEAKPIEWQKVAKSQENLLMKKGAIAGRLFAMRVAGMPVPRHEGYRLGALWWKQSLGGKARSVLGTLKRIMSRGYHRPAAWWSSADASK